MFVNGKAAAADVDRDEIAARVGDARPRPSRHGGGIGHIVAQRDDRTVGDREHIGADSLGHISLEGMIAATKQAEDRLCTACFTGQYPMDTPVDARHLLMTQVVT